MWRGNGSQFHLENSADIQQVPNVLNELLLVLRVSDKILLVQESRADSIQHLRKHEWVDEREERGGHGTL